MILQYQLNALIITLCSFKKYGQKWQSKHYTLFSTYSLYCHRIHSVYRNNRSLFLAMILAAWISEHTIFHQIKKSPKQNYNCLGDFNYSA